MRHLLILARMVADQLVGVVRYWHVTTDPLCEHYRAAQLPVTNH